MTERVDVVMLTLDADQYLEQCLGSLYREVPVGRLICVDGGSQDKTLQILLHWNGAEVYVRPDIRTTGKCVEFALGKVTTPWFLLMDADIELPVGWYQAMVRHQPEYDFFGCRRIMHYEFYRHAPVLPDVNHRPLGAPWMLRTEKLAGYHVDDDYMQRATDFLVRQVVEKNGGKYGEVMDTYHYHHSSDRPMYASDAGKSGSRLVFEVPRMEITDHVNWRKREDDLNKAFVKYIEPQYHYPAVDDGLLARMATLDIKWVSQTSPSWHRLIQDYKRRRHVQRWVSVKVGCTLRFAGVVGRAFQEYRKQLRER